MKGSKPKWRDVLLWLAFEAEVLDAGDFFWIVLQRYPHLGDISSWRGHPRYLTLYCLIDEWEERGRPERHRDLSARAARKLGEDAAFLERMAQRLAVQGTRAAYVRAQFPGKPEYREINDIRYVCGCTEPADIWMRFRHGSLSEEDQKIVAAREYLHTCPAKETT